MNKKMLNIIRDKYPVGTVVELVCMDDKQAPPRGTRGVVTHVDDVGTVHVNWENGSSLGIVYGVDMCRRV